MNRLIAYLLSIVVSLLPTFVYALNFNIEPRVQTGVLDYVFEQKQIEIPAEGLPYTDSDGTEVIVPVGETYTDSDGSSITNAGTPGDKSIDDGFKLISLMPLLGVGTTVFANRFFLDFYFQKAFSGSDIATNTQGYYYESTGPSLEDFVIDSDFERKESSLSFGYALSDQWVLFTGYRMAETSFADSISFDDKGTNARTRAREERNISFAQDGFFLGSTYVYSFQEYSAITFSAAVAVLEGEYDSRGHVIREQTGSVDSRPQITSEETGFDQKGDTVGLNLGVTWKGRMAEKIGYSVGVDGYSYDFEAKTPDVPDISETVLRLSAGLSYQFD